MVRLLVARFRHHCTSDRMVASLYYSSADRMFPSSLHYSSLLGLVDVTKWFLEKEAIVNAEGGHRHDNALRAASNGGHKAVVQLLLDAKVDGRRESRQLYKTLGE